MFITSINQFKGTSVISIQNNRITRQSFLKIGEKMEILNSFTTIFLLIVAWFVNEQIKIFIKERNTKVQKYEKAIQAIRCFYENKNNSEMIQNFLNNRDLLYLYASDEVITKISTFINTMYINNQNTADEQKHTAYREVIFSIRKDLFNKNILEFVLKIFHKKTKLKKEEYCLLKVSQQTIEK